MLFAPLALAAVAPSVELPADPHQLGLCAVVRLPIRPPPPAGWKARLDLARGAERARLVDGGAAVEVRTPCLSDCVPRPQEFTGIVPVDPRCAGVVRGALVFVDAGGMERARIRLDLAAAHPHPGTRGVPVDAWVHVAGPAGQGAWHWELGARLPGSVEVAMMSDRFSRVVRVRLLRADVYTLTDGISGARSALFAAEHGAPYGMCAGEGCHNQEVAGWRDTPHATAFSRAMRGQRGRFDDECLPCHVTGFTPGASDRGFDDLMAGIDWHVPPNLGAAALEAVPEVLRPLALVGCPSCHGPGRFTPGIVEDTICATCHHDPPRYPHVESWRAGRMSHAGRDLEPDDPPECRVCHTTRAFLRWQSRRLADSPLPPEPDEGIACAACHDPHRPARSLLRADMAEPGPGSSPADRLCGSCHRLFMPDFVRAADGTSHLGPAPVDVSVQAVRGLWGALAAGGASDLPPPPHRDVPCTGCHGNEGAPHRFGRGDEPARGCAECHKEKERRTRPLETSRPNRSFEPLEACGETFQPSDVVARRGALVYVDDRGRIAGDCDADGRPGSGERFLGPPNARAWWPRAIMAADPSGGAHDPWLAARVGAVTEPR